jgi:hypothetical protein
MQRYACSQKQPQGDGLLSSAQRGQTRSLLHSQHRRQLGDVQQIFHSRMHVDQQQVATVGLGGDVGPENASQSGAVDRVDAAQVGKHGVMRGRKALNFRAKYICAVQIESSLAHQCRSAIFGDMFFDRQPTLRTGSGGHVTILDAS